MDSSVLLLEMQKMRLEIQKMSKVIEIIPDMYNRISTIQNDITTIQNDVSTIKNDVANLNNRVSTIESNMSSFTLAKNFISYTRQDTAIQEIANEKLVFDYLTRKIPTSVFEMRKRFEFVDAYGNTITELDGCILMNVNQYTPTLRDNRIPNIVLKDDSRSIVSTHLQKTTIFIESKRTLDVPKVNKKIKQLIQMTEILRLLPSLNLATTHENFIKMVNEHNLHEFPKHVMMIFASNNISVPLKDLILEINNNTLTEDIYYKYICEALKSDTFYTGLKNDQSISQQNKIDLDQYITTQNINAIRNACRLRIYGDRSKFLIKYFPLYATMNSFYDAVKGNLGVLFIQDIIVPGLIPMTNTLELVGGSRLRSTVKRRRS
jgi:hypothetical protein